MSKVHLTSVVTQRECVLTTPNLHPHKNLTIYNNFMSQNLDWFYKELKSNAYYWVKDLVEALASVWVHLWPGEIKGTSRPRRPDSVVEGDTRTSPARRVSRGSGASTFTRRRESCFDVGASIHCLSSNVANLPFRLRRIRPPLDQYYDQ